MARSASGDMRSNRRSSRSSASRSHDSLPDCMRTSAFTERSKVFRTRFRRTYTEFGDVPSTFAISAPPSSWRTCRSSRVYSLTLSPAAASHTSRDIARASAASAGSAKASGSTTSNAASPSSPRGTRSFVSRTGTRSRLRAVLRAMVYSQPRTAPGSSSLSMERRARRNASCVTSAASCWFRSMRPTKSWIGVK